MKKTLIGIGLALATTFASATSCMITFNIDGSNVDVHANRIVDMRLDTAEPKYLIVTLTLNETQNVDLHIKYATHIESANEMENMTDYIYTCNGETHQ